MGQRAVRSLAILIAAALFSSCAGDSAESSSGDTTTTAPDNALVVSDLAGTYLALPADGIDPAVSVEITDDQLTYRSTCNSHFGGYDILDGVLVFDGAVTTLVGCEEPESMAVVGGVLTGRPSLAIADDGSIRLKTASRTLLLRSAATAAPNQPIDSRWEIATVLLGAIARWGTALTTAHIELASDRIVLDGPCTDGVVSIDRSGRSFTVIGSDFVPLPCDEAGTELEAALATVFDPAGVRQFEIVTTMIGIDLVPAVAPPDDQLDPAGLSLRAAEATPSDGPSAESLGGESIDGPVVRHSRPPDTDLRMLALIAGTLELENGCLYLRSDAGDVRYSVQWPWRTGWDDARQVVVLPNGVELAVGSRVEGGGGYFGTAAGSDDPAAQALAQCGGSEVAVFNNQPDAAGPG